MVFLEGRMGDKNKQNAGIMGFNRFSTGYSFYPILFLLLIFSSCNTGKFLESEEYLLRKNTVKIEGKVPEKGNLAYELSTFIRQQPNSRRFGIVSEYNYLKFPYADSLENRGFKRFLRRSFGEPPAIFNDSLMETSADAMRNYLKLKGYFNREVYAEEVVKGKHKVQVTYYAKPGPPFLIDSVFYESEDEGVYKMLQDIKGESLLKTGQKVDYEEYERDKKRVTTYLQNHGYANFYDSYFEKIQIDTNQANKRANIYINIKKPYDDSLHRSYRIGEVVVLPNFNPTLSSEGRRDSIMAPYPFIYRYQPGDLRVKLKAIFDAIYLIPGEIYSRENVDKTNQQLTNLGTYSFVRIKKEEDPDDPNVLNYSIQLSPNLKMELGMDFEVSFTNRSSLNAGNLIGFSLNPSYRNRNLFGGAELLVTDVSAGIEINPSFRSRSQDRRFYNTIDLGVQTELFIPKFIDYLNIYKFLYSIPTGKRKHFLTPAFYEKLRENAATAFTLRYNYLEILNWYRYNSFTASFGYDFPRSKTTRYRINHIGVDYLIPDTEEDFDRILAENGRLQRSFGRQLFVSLLFRELDFQRTGPGDRKGRSMYFNVNTELAGAEIWAANAIYNEFSTGEPTEWQPDPNTRFSQFFRLYTDVRYYKKYNDQSTFIARFTAGLARPFGFSDEVPYVKQFFAGGPNDIRAYFQNGLGPGGFLDSLTLNRDSTLRFYQTGDIKLQFNLEYRFKLFWRMRGALFIDGGNVWTFRRDDDRPGAQFLFRRQTYPITENGVTTQFEHQPFWRQVAIGGGAGLRFDFTYFIFRLDAAVQLRRNFPRNRGDGPIREADYWNNFTGFGLRDVAFQLGFGYPF